MEDAYNKESRRELNEERLKIAVFVDFDNIEIGVKTTLNRRFDIGTVLEAIKERGEVVTKVAYGNWWQAESYSRQMTEHAIQMVQRNPTPGGDKNGADINLALDALEMAFTRDHINAFVIVGGDSDFIALVEKLKQYDKKVLIVGGRAFTSVILQKNCHEFISYENLLGLQSGGARRASGKETASRPAPMERAMPLIRRALKVLSDREVSPQLGLLKSTLLQLDSTFSEREYGAGSFREFIQKLAKAGLVTLKQVDRSLLVELKEGEAAAQVQSAPRAAAPGPASDLKETAPAPAATADALRIIRSAFQSAKKEVRWPLYLRNVKQVLRAADPSFDERRLGYSGLQEFVRDGQKAGLLRIERDRQGILRIFAGDQLALAPREEEPEMPLPEAPLSAVVESEPAVAPAAEPGSAAAALTPEEWEEKAAPEALAELQPPEKAAKRRGAPRARKKTARKPRAKNARKTSPPK